MLGIVSLDPPIGKIGVMKIVFVSITERTAEIGLRKVVSACHRGVLWQFLLEAMMLTVKGSVAGVLIGIAIALSIQFLSPSLRASISAGAITAGLIVSMSVGLFFDTSGRPISTHASVRLKRCAMSGEKYRAGRE